MANWALIIGVDVYDVATYRLRGAVNDAVAFLQWCVDPAGGAVPPENINLLLDVQPTAGPVADLLTHTTFTTPATRDAVSTAISDLLRRSNGIGDRCFFYFAGHGLTARQNATDVPCICLRNFTPALTNNALSLPSIFERFRATQFKEQYFFVDACRNIPFSTEFQVSEFDRPVAPSGPVFPQFIVYATQPRNTAAELVQPGYEGGAFTQSLIQGLGGSGAAKQWDASNGRYLVRWNSLFRFVEKRVSDMSLPSPVAANRGVIQTPRQFGEKGGEDPVLSLFPDGQFGLLRLQIDFNPRAAAQDTGLSVGEAGFPPKQYPAPIGAVPWGVDLQPRIYGIVTSSQQYQSKRRMELVELYEPLPVTIDMIPLPPAVPLSVLRDIAVRTLVVPVLPTEFSTGMVGENPQYQDVHSIESVLKALSSRAETTPDLRPSKVISPDPLAQLEIADESGHIVATGRGELSLPSSALPGFFRARIIAPNGAFDEKLLAMAPKGSGPPFEITPVERMTKGLHWAIKNSGVGDMEAGLITPSEAIGPAAFVKLSTMLALAAGARAEGNSGPPGGKLRSLPLPDSNLAGHIDDNSGGIQVLLGDELLALDWSSTTLTVSPTYQPESRQEPLIQLSPVSHAIASAEWALSPGSYWLQIEAPGVATLRIALTILPNRIALLVLTQESDRSIELHQYSLLVVRGGQKVPQPLMDPEFRDARFPAIRRIELMQRTYARGRLSPALPDIESLLAARWADPIAGCLGGYMLLRLQRPQDLNIPSTTLCKSFGDLPDAWVLRAAYLDVKGKKEATQAVIHALEKGIPIFVEGIRTLDNLASRLAPAHPRATQFAQFASESRIGGIFTTLAPISSDHDRRAETTQR